MQVEDHPQYQEAMGAIEFLDLKSRPWLLKPKDALVIGKFDESSMGKCRCVWADRRSGVLVWRKYGQPITCVHNAEELGLLGLLRLAAIP